MLKGISLSSLVPYEVIVVHINEAAYSLDYNTSAIKQIELPDANALPLAKARNLAAQNASTQTLLFLDVDCIPAPDCFEQLLTNQNAITMADPYYLQTPVDNINFESFATQAKPNNARSSLVFGNSQKYELFWSLGFAISKDTFNKIGGFDQNFTGYGGEDTDFAFSARSANIPLYFSHARVYHQPHNSYDPPLNWLEDIIINAQVFYKKWQTWPMEGWLTKFQSMGYIDWQADTITLVRKPSTAEIKGALKQD